MKKKPISKLITGNNYKRFDPPYINVIVLNVIKY